jgi:hypothetical protein
VQQVIQVDHLHLSLITRLNSRNPFPSLERLALALFTACSLGFILDS